MAAEIGAAPVRNLPRLEFEQLEPGVQERLAPRVKRLGYLGEFFKCAGHQPAALAAFVDFTESCKGALPARIVELLALTCAGWMGNSYEKHQHERLSVRLGFEREWVRDVNQLQPETAARLTAQDRSLQRFALDMLSSRGTAVTNAFNDLVAELGPAAAVAVLMVMGRYVTHGLIVNALALAPPVPSIFEDGFGAAEQ